MDKDPETLEEALAVIKIWKQLYWTTLAKLATARAEALMEADVVAVCDGCHQHLALDEIEPYGTGYCHVVPNGDPETGEMWPEPCGPVYIMRRSDLPITTAILTDKQEEPVDYRNTLFGYPVVVDASIPHDRLIIMTPAVFDDLKKHLESTMLDKQEGEK